MGTGTKANGGTVCTHFKSKTQSQTETAVDFCQAAPSVPASPGSPRPCPLPLLHARPIPLPPPPMTQREDDEDEDFDDDPLLLN